MKKLLIGVLTVLAVSTTLAQTVYIASGAKNQVLVYRYASSGAEGCGIRTVFMTDVPKGNNMGDMSVNVFKNQKGEYIGLTKMIYASVPNINNLETKNIPISQYSMVNSAGKTLRFNPTFQAGDVKNSLSTQTSVEDAIDFLFDLASQKTVQVGIVFKAEKNTRIFSIKAEKLEPAEAEALSKCISQLMSDGKKQ
jgi:hypothetical protein